MIKRVALVQFHKDWEVCRNRARLLRAFNPDVEIYGLFGGEAGRFDEARQALVGEFEALHLLRHPDRQWKWKNTDLAVRSWYRDFGSNREFDVLHAVQWDLLLLAPLDELYRGIPSAALGLTGITTVDAIADRWPWTVNEPQKTELVRLRDFAKRELGYDEPFKTCLGPGYCLPRGFLEAYAGADVPELCHDEIRLPLYAATLGFEIADTGFYPRWFDTLEERFFNADGDDIDEKLIRSELARPRGRRAFHPFRKEFAPPAPAPSRRSPSAAGRPRRRAGREDFQVVAIVAAYNEADIISPLIEHLVSNGVDVYLIDNRSTDATVEEARRWLGKGLLQIEQFPKESLPAGAAPEFDWEGILRRKEEIAAELSADWYIHNDADEFREAPWPDMPLKEAIRWVDRLGYNCIDFRVLNFRPVDAGFPPGSDPKKHFTRWEEPILHDTVRLNCWKKQADPVSLAASGGHDVRFSGRRVFPIKFLLRHYPIRGQEHGRRKIFEERKKRFLERERAMGWHVQYDGIEDPDHSFLSDEKSLHPYDEDHVRLDLMLDNEAARTAEERARDLASEVEARRLEVAGLQAGKHETEKHAANLEKDREKLTNHLIERERHIANLETLKAEAERHAASLGAERKEIVARLGERERQVSNLESKVGELQRHASGLENDRKTLAAHIAHLEELRTSRESQAAGAAARLAELERHADGLEKDRETLARHISHLEAVRAEKDGHIAMLNAERVERAEVEGRRLALEARLDELTARSRDLEDRFTAMRTRANREEGLRRESEIRAERAERDLTAMRRSTLWRMTAPARRLLDVLKRALRAEP